MSIAEILLVVAGLSINVFLISQKDGAMIRRIRPGSLLMLCVFFFVFESLSMLAGFRLTRITFFRNSSSTDLKKFCYFCAVVLFLIIAAYMLFKAFTEREIDEHLTEISITRTILQAIGVAVFAAASGGALSATISTWQPVFWRQRPLSRFFQGSIWATGMAAGTEKASLQSEAPAFCLSGLKSLCGTFNGPLFGTWHCIR